MLSDIARGGRQHLGVGLGYAVMSLDRATSRRLIDFKLVKSTIAPYVHGE